MNTSNLTWESSILELSKSSKPAKNTQKLIDAGFKTIKDLLWIFPLRIIKTPELTNFAQLIEGELFLGKGEIISINLTPAFGKKGKNRVQLFNATVVVKDSFSDRYLNLKWFNAYPNLKKQLESLKEFTFMGQASLYNGLLQITNPKLNPKEISTPGETIREYPTVNTVPGNHTLNLINKIPKSLWQQPLNILQFEIINALGLNTLNQGFLEIHGLQQSENDSKENIILQEFLSGQLKVLARKLKNQKLKSKVFNIEQKHIEDIQKLFPYNLTQDQGKALDDIKNDLKKSFPMMRLIQGDVGCGKTTVALIAALMIADKQGQVAFMCPTEALATQHFKTFESLLPSKYKFSLLVGSTKTKVKKDIYHQLSNGEIDIVIGTHALFQESVQFKNLQLAIIDEQHKFGVGQRQKLINKGNGVHTIIMTATPIPRSLQLAQYGDLEISTIRTIPAGRKGTQTRIVTDATYQKYLSFIKTRVSLGEQIYIVVPAIEESETQDINNVNNHLEQYKRFFPDLKISALHGQLKPEEKSLILEQFTIGNIDILISTTVIEVGINVINSTVMSIYNPERFGLSSLHQLRGRVGRGEKAGFCFLVTDKKISQEAMHRLKIVEKTRDGFEIAEADLSNRGQGDLFGSSQSGHLSSYKLANIFEHFPIFEKSGQLITELQKSNPEVLNNYLLKLLEDQKVSSTI